jgi:hypothetical protein
MLPAITSTHAVPKQLPPGRLHTKGHVAICPYCFEDLGTAPSSMKRRELETRHACKEKQLAQQPATAIPFN